MGESFEGEKFIMGREGGDYYSGFYVDWLEEKLEATERAYKWIVDAAWLGENVRLPDLKEALVRSAVD